MADEKEVDDIRADLSEAYDAIDAKDQGLEPPVKAEPVPSEPQQIYDGRDERGRFAKQTDTGALEPVPGQGETQGVATPQPPHPVASPSPMGPPSSWSIQAKASFDALPPPVRDAIAKREAEVAHGFQQYQERYRPLDPFIETARQANVDPAEAIKAWMNAEKLLNRDFDQGMRSLCEHYNVEPRALAAHWLGGNGSQQPQQYQGQGGQMPHPVQQEIYALKNELAEFKRAQEEEQFSGIMSEVDAFRAKPENKYFENVRPFMAQLIRSGAANGLQDAYEQACWSHPEIRQLQINAQVEARTQANRGKASEARRAAGSLNPGSPLPGATQGRNSGKSQSVRDDLLETWDTLSA